jgi:hypothetical protein
MRLGEWFESARRPSVLGALSDPSVGQVAALASVFGVEASYLLERGESYLLDEELVQALRDEDGRDIARETAPLPDRERQLVLGIVRQFRDQKAALSGESWRRL